MSVLRKTLIESYKQKMYTKIKYLNELNKCNCNLHQTYPNHLVRLEPNHQLKIPNIPYIHVDAYSSISIAC